ncbi:hypothetical protein ACWEQL_31455 [Kitasatospora sp. NPDC004240]
MLAYLESGRNLAGCGGGAVGLALHFAGLGGTWWPGMVAALYGAGVLLWPGGSKPSKGAEAETGRVSGAPGAVPVTVPGPVVVPGPVTVPGPVAAPEPPVKVPERPAKVPAPEPARSTAVRTPARSAADLSAEVDALIAALSSVPLPPSPALEGLLDRLRDTPADHAEARRILSRRLPVAVDGYLRARTWRPWAPGEPDPAVVLDREVERMAAVLAA